MSDSAPKRKRRTAQRKNLFDVDIEATSNLSKSAPVSLFDDPPDSGGDDLFDFGSKPPAAKVDLFKSTGIAPQDELFPLGATAPPDAARKRKPARKRAAGAPPPVDLGAFGYRDVRVRFGGVGDFRREVVRRFDHYESLVRSITVAQSGGRALSSPIPDDVLRESVHRLVSDLREKDAALREKAILIDFLRERVTSTFERDELAKEQSRRRAEVESERAETAEQSVVVEQLRGQLEQLRSDLAAAQADAERAEAAARAAHEQEQYRVAMEHFGEQEPLERKMKDAKNEKMQIEIQLMPMLEDIARMKEGIDIEAFEGIAKLKVDVPKRISAAIREMRDGVAAMLENAFNPLREYTGDKIATAVRNALQAQGRRVLSK
jgi:hypothetical protein